MPLSHDISTFSMAIGLVGLVDSSCVALGEHGCLIRVVPIQELLLHTFFTFMYLTCMGRLLSTLTRQVATRGKPNMAGGDRVW